MNRFLRASLIRALRTVVQTAVAAIGTAAVLSEVNWAVVASASGYLAFGTDYRSMI